MKRFVKWGALALTLLLTAFPPAWVIAATLQVGVTGTITGLANNTQINVVAANLAALEASGTAPTTASTGLSSTADVWWYDTANKTLKKRNHADTAWIPIVTVDETNGVAMPVLPGYRFGTTIANNSGTPNTKVDIAAGIVADDTGVTMMRGNATVTVDFGTTGANGLDTGSIAASKCYFIWSIGQADGTYAGFADRCDLAGLSPTLPSGYIYKRRDGSVLTDASSHILAFTQKDSKKFEWASAPGDQNFVASFSSGLLTLSVPTGITVDALIRANAASAGPAYQVLIQDPAESSSAVNTPTGNFQLVNDTGGSSGGQFQITTDTSGRVRAGSSLANISFRIVTFGWIDTSL